MKRTNILKVNLWILIGVLALTSCERDSFISEEDGFETQVHEHHLGHRNCGKDHHMEELLSDPAYRMAYEKRMEKFETYQKENVGTRALCSSPVVIPVAVHYQGVASPNTACLVALAQTQIAVLNNDFQGTNSDISKWNSDQSHFPGISNGETCVEFVLANQNHPSGYGLNNGDLAVTVNKTSGDQVNQWSGYLNFFIQPNTGLLGYSPLGGAGNGDGVVIDANAFGVGSGCNGVTPQSPYNLGRTLTHELGHYLNLDHIWGNGCGVDDLVSDTPNQSAENYDCPNVPQSSCGSKDLSMNYMDYVNDACMYMFSNGQSTRMENYINSSLTGLVNNASNVISSGGNTGGGNDGDSDPTEECAKPSDSSASNITETRATISWTDMPEAIKYRIKYKEVGTSGYTYRTTTNPTKTLTGLIPGATYQYNVRTQCPQGWTSYTTEYYFTLAGGGSGGGDQDPSCADIKVTLKLDDFPEETTWEIVDDQTNQVVLSGGPYNASQAGKTKNKTICLADGLYSFYIDDEYGDGICCDYGNGSVKLKNGNGQVFAALDGYFGYYDVIYFEIANGTASFKSEDKDVKQVQTTKKQRDNKNYSN